MDTKKNYKVWKITTESICKGTGYSRDRVRKDYWKGLFDPTDVWSLSCYVLSARLGDVAKVPAPERPDVKPKEKAIAESCYDYSSSQERGDGLSVFDRPATTPAPDVPF